MNSIVSARALGHKAREKFESVRIHRTSISSYVERDGKEWGHRFDFLVGHVPQGTESCHVGTGNIFLFDFPPQIC
jgi:hypothetical protein